MQTTRLFLLCGLMSVSACTVGDTTDDGPVQEIVNDLIPEEGVATVHSILHGTFSPMGTYQNISGVAELVRMNDGNTRVDIQLAGLPAGLAHKTHLHMAPCAYNAGGHYKLDPAVAEAEETNEIWPVFTSDDEGIGRAQITVAHLARGEALSVVVHDPESPENAKMACADLVAQDGGNMIAEGSFAPVLPAQARDANIAGSAKLERTGTTTTVTLGLTGLDAGSEYVSHVHALPCEIDNGGGHYKMDPTLETDNPLVIRANELWPVIPGGGLTAYALLGPVQHATRADAQSVVIHRIAGQGKPKVACSNLVRTVFPSSTMTGGETLLEVGMQEVANMTASATIERRLDGTTAVNLDLTSLEADTYYKAHVHNLPCDVANGGGHYKTDPTVTEAVRDNEIWFGLKADEDGNAKATGFASHIARAEAQSIVIHNGKSGDRLACVSMK